MTQEIDKTIHYKNMVIKEATVDLDKRTFKAIISSEIVDREGEVIKAAGMNLSQFKKIGTILFNHNRDFVLGSPTSVKRVGKDIVMKADFADEGTGEDIDKVYKLVQQGHLKTMSVGFQYLEHPRQPTKEDMRDFKGVRLVAQKTLLLEASIVSVPANQDAIILSCKDLDMDPKIILGEDYEETTEVMKKVEKAEEEIETINKKIDVMIEDIHTIETIESKEDIKSEKDLLIEKIKKELRQDIKNKEIVAIIKEELIKNELIRNGRIFY